MKNVTCQFLTFTLVVGLSTAFPRLGSGQIELDEDATKWKDLAVDVASNIPEVGPFLSPISGLLFSEKDQIAELRNELKAYTDTKVLQEDKRLKEDLLNNYNEHLKNLRDFEGSQEDYFPILRGAEEEIGPNWVSFKSKGDQKATRNLLFMSAQAQLHLRILDKIMVQKLHDPYWKKHDARIWKDYKNYATSQVDKVIKERLALVTKVSVKKKEIRRGPTDRSPQGTKIDFYYIRYDDKSPNPFPSPYNTGKERTLINSEIDEEFPAVEEVRKKLEKDRIAYMKLVEYKTRAFWKKHLLDPIMYERERIAFEGLLLHGSEGLSFVTGTHALAIRNLDRNKDGELQMAEIPFNRVGKPSQNDLFSKLGQYNKNKDGAWDKTELAAFFARPGPARQIYYYAIYLKNETSKVVRFELKYGNSRNAYALKPGEASLYYGSSLSSYGDITFPYPTTKAVQPSYTVLPNRFAKKPTLSDAGKFYRRYSFKQKGKGNLVDLVRNKDK